MLLDDNSIQITIFGWLNLNSNLRLQLLLVKPAFLLVKPPFPMVKPPCLLVQSPVRPRSTEILGDKIEPLPWRCAEIRGSPLPRGIAGCARPFWGTAGSAVPALNG